MKITVVTPTIFRPTLRRAVEEVGQLLLPGDEHIVVRDAARDAADLDLYKNLPVNEYTKYFEAYVPFSSFGNAQRDLAIHMAAGDCIVFLDDDDLPHPDAYKVIHELEPDPNVTHVFKMYREYDRLTFEGGVHKIGGFGGPMLVAPRRPDLPKWYNSNNYISDFLWGTALKNLPGMRFENHEEFICIVPTPSTGK